MKVVSKLQSDLSLCLDTLNRIISERIKSIQNNSKFSLNRFKSEAFENSLDKILQLPFPISFEEKIVLFLVVSPYIKPGFLDEIITRALPERGKLKDFGGIKGKQPYGLLPTGETALFLLAGTSPSKRLKYQKLFKNESKPGLLSLLKIQPVANDNPFMNGRLDPDPDWLERILMDLGVSPSNHEESSVREITTNLKWEDLVLNPQTREKINEIEIWLNRRAKILKDPNFERKVKPGYRAIFYGRVGTGKTLTAALVGKQFNIPVYRIDLSLVVSRYIGETEKNLEKVLSVARDKDWILFFDEADALFGKRTNVQDAHDKYANQEVSYFLQQIEQFEGLWILAINEKRNLDDAFIRRFNNFIHFSPPGPAERCKLWVKNIPEKLTARDIDWNSISEKFKVTGAEIVNAMHYAVCKSHSRKDDKLIEGDIEEGIKKQLRNQYRDLLKGAGEKKIENNN